MAKPKVTKIDGDTVAKAPSTEDTLVFLQSRLSEETEQRELWQRRYTQEHQRGLELELAGQKAEKLAKTLDTQLQEAREALDRLTAIKESGDNDNSNTENDDG